MVERAWAQSLARHLGELSRVAVLGLDAEGRVLRANAAADRLYGWHDGVHHQARVAELFSSSAESASFEALLGAVVTDGASAGPVLLRVTAPDGRVRQLETSLSAGDELMPVMCVQVDVTEGAEIRAREEELRVAQAVAHVGNWRLNLQTRALTWSDETYRIFGVPVGEPVNLERFFSLIHPDDLPTIQAAWQAALDGAPYDVEHRIVVGEEVLWVRERAELRQGPGEAPSALGTVQEITERKSHKLALAEERRRLAEVMSATGVGTWEWDLHTDVLTVS
ncbi:MAG: PAS domain-containing protein, partial [Deltaproteobacteria bacterium]|nr:PAS domain-containing protein [Deltaproteobacteria bacterium]